MAPQGLFVGANVLKNTIFANVISKKIVFLYHSTLYILNERFIRPVFLMQNFPLLNKIALQKARQQTPNAAVVKQMENQNNT